MHGYHDLFMHIFHPTFKMVNSWWSHNHRIHDFHEAFFIPPGSNWHPWYLMLKINKNTRKLSVILEWSLEKFPPSQLRLWPAPFSGSVARCRNGHGSFWKNFGMEWLTQGLVKGEKFSFRSQDSCLWLPKVLSAEVGVPLHNGKYLVIITILSIIAKERWKQLRYQLWIE